jgi:hypothetical protein
MYQRCIGHISIMDFNRQFTGKEEKAMAKEYAKSFYKSDKWLQCKKSFIAERRAIDGGLCQRCRKRYGYIVHHRQHITPENITDPMVTLSHTNLEYLCQECHNKEHFGDAGLRYMIGEDGQPISPSMVDNRLPPRDRLQRWKEHTGKF